MKRVLVIGASGFVGGNLAAKLLSEGYFVRCLVRNTTKVKDLADAGCQIIKGDISDASSLESATKEIDAVYISIQTLVPQPGSPAGQGFMEIELRGLRNIISACKLNQVHRIIYVTFLGADANSPSEWVRERWNAEQLLVNSGLNATIIRPGMIVGIGGLGFGMTVSNAKKRVAILIGDGQQKMRSIAIDDLVYYMIGVMNDPRTYSRCYDVGNNDVFTANELVDQVADVLGRRHPGKFHIPRRLLGFMAPLIERITRSPKGAIKGGVDAIGLDCVGEPSEIRTLLPKPLMTFREAVKVALKL